ncbi:hypothetical protein [Guptibacillus hwajinpoensis]|uniref:Uncharacterized protein n=1 Tax=Guptibacillus hwajinpoensis TaxID=208199 RepID=A0ABU0JXL5_9BACL|nr:hypothetical protein [Alkalihalobacillus hemicentroti]MDQ0481832.1 hypothetical protein [Alkalihalobacillus hemicentroti]
MVWIMTQDKKSLLNVKEISIRGKSIEGVVERRFFIEWKKTLATYETQERAMEVLEEIHKKIYEANDIITIFHMPTK